MIYIDMNMVRAGAVSHPSQWSDCGFKEILTPRQRYGIIDQTSLLNSLGLNSIEDLKQRYPKWLDESLLNDRMIREEKWSKSIAVGSYDYIEMIQSKLGIDAINRKLEENDGVFQLREEEASYGL